MDKVKIGVVGMGRGRYVMERAIDEPVCDFTSVCDHNKEKLDEAMESLKKLGKENVKPFSDYDEFLRSDIDAVYIATDAIYHVPFVIKALNAGKHVLSEIPPVNSIEEAKELKVAVKAHPHLKYMAGENCCFWGFIQAWKKMYDNGKFGETVYAEAEYLHSSDYNEFDEKDYPKGHWRTFNPAIKYLTHDLGPLLYIMNDRCVSVSCMVPDINYNPYKTIEAQNGVALFKTEKGAVIRILVSFGSYVGFDHNFRILGTKGTIETDSHAECDTAHSFARFDDIPDSINKMVEIPINAMSFGGKEGAHGGADEKMMKAFAECIINDTEPPIDVDMGINMAIPGIIAAESAKNGGSAIEIPVI